LIVGCGNIAGGFDMTRSPALPPLSHAGAYANHGGFRLVACVDPDTQQCGNFAQHWNVKKQATRLEELDATPGTFDVISICSPTPLHRQHVEQALCLQPRVIFCEKPLTSDVTDAEKLIAECEARGVYLIVNYSRHWDPAVEEFVAAIRAHRWGAVRSAVGHYNKGILNNGSHMIDLLLRLVGPLEVVTTSCLVNDFGESDPTVAVLLTAREAGIPIYLSPGNAKDFAYFELELVCEKGVVRIVDGGMGWQYREVMSDSLFTGYRSLGKASYIQGRYLETMSRAVDDIYAYLQTGKSAGTRNEHLLAVQELCTRIQQIALDKRAQYRT
jgi:predicted dehydrogenase